MLKFDMITTIKNLPPLSHFWNDLLRIAHINTDLIYVSEQNIKNMTIKGTCNPAVKTFWAFLKPFNRTYSPFMYFLEF